MEMMPWKYLILCFLIFTVCSWTSRAAGYMYLKPMKVGSGNCVDDEWQEHPVGSLWTDKKKCEEQECLYIKGVLYVRASGCGALGYSPECKMVPGKEGADYPDCCPQVECPEVEYYYYDTR